MFSQACIILFTVGGGSTFARGVHEGGQHGGAGIPPHRDTVNQQSVRILLDCNLIF